MDQHAQSHGKLMGQWRSVSAIGFPGGWLVPATCCPDVHIGSWGKLSTFAVVTAAKIVFIIAMDQSHAELAVSERRSLYDGCGSCARVSIDGSTSHAVKCGKEQRTFASGFLPELNSTTSTGLSRHQRSRMCTSYLMKISQTWHADGETASVCQNDMPTWAPKSNGVLCARWATIGTSRPRCASTHKDYDGNFSFLSRMSLTP